LRHRNSIIWIVTPLGLALACSKPTRLGVAPNDVDRTVILTEPAGARIVVDGKTLATGSPIVARYHRQLVDGVAQPLRIRALPIHPDECPQFVLIPRGVPAPDTVRFVMNRCPQSDQDLAKVFVPDEVDELPERLRGPMPDPEYLMLSRTPGCVLVRIVIDTTGLPDPESLEIVRSTDPGFIPSATKAALGSIFRPARLFGRKVRIRVEMPVSYSFGDGDVRRLTCA